MKGKRREEDNEDMREAAPDTPSEATGKGDNDELRS